MNTFKTIPDELNFIRPQRYIYFIRIYVGFGVVIEHVRSEYNIGARWYRFTDDRLLNIFLLS